MRRIRLTGSPASRGRAHGEAAAAEIRAYAADRVGLAGDGTWAGRSMPRAEVLALAEEMWPAHQRYAPALAEELEALAGAAGLSRAEALIVGGFTDFVDAVRSRLGAAPFEDDCTAVLTTDGINAQTWDMHASATRHAVLLELDDALLFSTVGCLGQIGMNADGLAIGITNLTSADGGVGVTWPFVVRKVLEARTVEAALPAILEPPLAGGHTYILLDAAGDGAIVEAMPSHRSVARLGAEVMVHTNHCLDPQAAVREAPRAEALVASSHDRLRIARRALSEGVDIAAVLRLAGICRPSEPPFHMETAGLVLMRPRTREMWVTAGSPPHPPLERHEVKRHV